MPTNQILPDVVLSDQAASPKLTQSAESTVASQLSGGTTARDSRDGRDLVKYFYYYLLFIIYYLLFIIYYYLLFILYSLFFIMIILYSFIH